MDKGPVAALVVVSLLIAVAGVSQEAPVGERLTITDKGSGHELTVPVSRLVMTIPKGGFVPSKPSTDAPDSPGRKGA